MPFASAKRLLAALVLAWFVALLAVAGIAPAMQSAGGPGDVVCTAGGTIPAPDGDTDAALGQHTLKCGLCLGIAAPPAAPVVALPAIAPLPHVLLPLPAARLASLVGAPLPARGPPSYS